MFVSNGTVEIIETKLQRQLLTRSFKDQVFVMCTSIVSSGTPIREWYFVTEHMSLVDVMTSYSTSDKSKTIFEGVYGFVPDVDSLPSIGCFVCRLEETKEKSDRKLGIRNTPGTFVGFATLKNCSVGVILTGKNTQNPRYEGMYNILGRVNDKLQTNDDYDSGKKGLQRV